MNKSRFLVALFAFSLALTVQATEPARSSAATIEYTVQPGDTISDLSERFLGGRARWGAITKINPGLDIEKLHPGQVIRLPESRVQSVGKTAKILKVNGRATSAGTPLQEGQQLSAGTVIDVAADSFVTLGLADGSILVVEPNTRARIEELRLLATGAQRATVHIDQGRVDVKAAPQKAPGARFQISTPSATTAVRGTRFRVGESADGSTVTEVTEGLVNVNSPDAAKCGKCGVSLTAGTGTIVASGQAPIAPEALLPAPNLHTLPTQYTQTIVEISFPKVDGATAYRATVARDATFDDVVASAEDTQPQIKVAGLPDGVYYLRARAISSSGLHGMEASADIVLHARPEPPFASAPANERKLAAGPVHLIWSAPENAASYDVNITKDGTPIQRLEQYADASYILNAEPGQYRWQLATRDRDGRLGPFGSWYSFTAVPPPSVSGAEASLVEDDGTLTLAWAGAANQTYHWQIDADNTFQKVLLEGDTATPSITIKAPDAGTYFVRVRASTSDGVDGPYSSPQKIIVPEQSSGFPFWILLILIPLAL